MSKSFFAIEIDVSNLVKAADGIGSAASDPLGPRVLQLVNSVAETVEDRGVKRMTKVVNLTEQYVRTRMSIARATNPLAPRARVVAAGGRNDMTPLSRYPMEQRVKKVKWDNDWIGENKGPKQIGKWPKWTLRKGDSARGIDEDLKQDGIAVNVLRGKAPGVLQWGFTLPLRRGNQAGGNGVGVFTRGKDGKLVKHRYGPSVYQLFREAAGELEGQTADELEELVLAEAQRQLARNLA